LFTFNHVPVKFITGQRLLASTTAGRVRLARVLHKLIPWKDDGKLDRLAVFLTNGNVASQEEVFSRLCMFYPSDARFAVHSIDFDYMGAGKAPKPFTQQLSELALLKQKFPQKLYPFFCADPRRPDLFELFRRYIEEENFTGIKLYPSLGFFPFDERLYPLYEYAQKYNLPVTTHCSASGPVFGRNIPPPKERIHPKTQEVMNYSSKKQFGDHYTDPDNYLWLLKDFPQLKLCFAHFGGDAQCIKYYKSNDPIEIQNNWFVKVLKMLRSFPHTYSDISYAGADMDLLALFSALLHDREVSHKVLFGSDYYMSNLERNERWFSMNVRMGLGEESYMKIAHDNAVKFLNILE
jgi:predicted TIM-barrel fold metal-dependent hydrolase